MENINEWEIFGREDLDKKDIITLKAKGYIFTPNKVCIYHPKHWKYIGAGIMDWEKEECIDPGDFWYYEDAFKALTSDALQWAEEG